MASIAKVKVESSGRDRLSSRFFACVEASWDRLARRSDDSAAGRAAFDSCFARVAKWHLEANVLLIRNDIYTGQAGESTLPPYTLVPIPGLRMRSYGRRLRQFSRLRSLGQTLSAPGATGASS